MLSTIWIVLLLLGLGLMPIAVEGGKPPAQPRAEKKFLETIDPHESPELQQQLRADISNLPEQSRISFIVRDLRMDLFHVLNAYLRDKALEASKLPTFYGGPAGQRVEKAMGCVAYFLNVVRGLLPHFESQYYKGTFSNTTKKKTVKWLKECDRMEKEIEKKLDSLGSTKKQEYWDTKRNKNPEENYKRVNVYLRKGIDVINDNPKEFPEDFFKGWTRLYEASKKIIKATTVKRGVRRGGRKSLRK